MQYTLWNEWSPKEQDRFRDWLTGILKTDIVEIVFTKQDGSERMMNATLQEDRIPVVENKTTRTRAPNPDVVSVVDADLGQWRSIRYDSINSIKVTFE